MRKALFLVTVLAVTLTACAEPSEQAVSDPTQIDWVLESGTLGDGPIPIVDTHPITLTFEENQAGGTSACNSYFGDYTISGGELSFGELGQTMMVCSPDEVMESEAKYLEALALAESFSMTDDTLTLTGDGVELVFVVGEGTEEPEEPVAADPTEIAWEMESGTLDGEPIPILGSHPITLSFTEEGAGGTAACNGYGGSYSISGDEITFSEVFGTEMACMPEEAMESEQKYLDAFIRVETFSMSHEMLTLSGDGVELVFVALPPVPTSELTGTVWILDGLVQGEAVSSVMGERATLELFSDGSMLGSTGCRSLNGRYTVSGAEVLMPEMAAEGECPAELQDQDSLVVTVLGDGFGVAIEGDTLILTASGKEGLVYKAAD